MAPGSPSAEYSNLRLDVVEVAGGRALRAGGDWVIGNLSEVDASLRRLKDGGARIVNFDVSQVRRVDTAGAWLLHRAAALMPGGAKMTGAAPALADLISEVAKHDQPPPARPHHANAFVATVERMGAGVTSAMSASVALLAFTGLILGTAARMLSSPRRIRVTPIVHHIEAVGLNAVPIIALISFLVGAVIAFLAADILENYGTSIFSVDLISFAFLREFGVLLAAIMVAGRSGSAFTAEIGVMKGNEEIDAMRALGLDPVELLVLPRVLALLVSLPLLTVIADIMGLVGGAIADWLTLGLTPASFVNRFLEATKAKQFWVGLIKAPVFAYFIAMIGCFQGMKVTGSAESLGVRTTLSVVQAIFMVIVVDALFAIFFLQIHF
jgi:phospholipid/cholesterol/gamma-HCH transport system permease protein